MCIGNQDSFLITELNMEQKLKQCTCISLCVQLCTIHEQIAFDSNLKSRLQQDGGAVDASLPGLPECNALTLARMRV